MIMAQQKKERLLLITQIVDEKDFDLGFFVRWISEFAKHYEHVSVICLKEGTHQLPENVSVYSLGKENNRSRLKYIVNLYRYVWMLRGDYDKVFVHMNPEYIVLCGLLWKFLHKPVALWYVHKSVTHKLRAAVRVATVVFTASRESFRIDTPKVRIVGHGIDTNQFNCARRSNRNALRLVTVGRITPSKGLHTIIDALGELRRRGVLFSCDVIGAPYVQSDEQYFRDVMCRVREKMITDSIHFLGARTHDEVAKSLCGYDVFLHASRGTGSIDKAGLEAMSSGLLLVSCSEAYEATLSSYGLFVRNPHEMVDAICMTVDDDFRASVSLALREWVVSKNSLPNLIQAISHTW